MKKREDKFITRWAKRYRAVQELGGKCQECGETNIFLLDFHHLDPTKKEFGISSLSARASWDEIKSEIEKCILLCKSCHTEFHTKELSKKFHDNLDKIVEKSKTVHSIKRPKLDDNYIYEMLIKKFSLNFIAKSINKDVSSVRDVALNLEKKYNKQLFPRISEYNLSKEKISTEELIKLYKEGKRAKEIAQMYSMQKSTLFERIRNLKKKGLL